MNYTYLSITAWVHQKNPQKFICNVSQKRMIQIIHPMKVIHIIAMVINTLHWLVNYIVDLKTLTLVCYIVSTIMLLLNFDVKVGF